MNNNNKIANGFKKKSWVNFDNCMGCVYRQNVSVDKQTKQNNFGKL